MMHLISIVLCVYITFYVFYVFISALPPTMSSLVNVSLLCFNPACYSSEHFVNFKRCYANKVYCYYKVTFCHVLGIGGEI